MLKKGLKTLALSLPLIASDAYSYTFTECGSNPVKRQSGNLSLGYPSSYEGGTWHNAMKQSAYALNQNPSNASVTITNPSDSEKIYFTNPDNVPGWQSGWIAMEVGIHECWKDFKDLKLTWERDIRNVRIMFSNKERWYAGNYPFVMIQMSDWWKTMHSSKEHVYDFKRVLGHEMLHALGFFHENRMVGLMNESYPNGGNLGWATSQHFHDNEGLVGLYGLHPEKSQKPNVALGWVQMSEHANSPEGDYTVSDTLPRTYDYSTHPVTGLSFQPIGPSGIPVPVPVVDEDSYLVSFVVENNSAVEIPNQYIAPYSCPSKYAKDPDQCTLLDVLWGTNHMAPFSRKYYSKIIPKSKLQSISGEQWLAIAVDPDDQKEGFPSGGYLSNEPSTNTGYTSADSWGILGRITPN